MAPKGPPNYCVLMTSATLYNLGVLGPFWARKRAEISPKMVSITCYWAPNGLKICLEWPQNDSQTPPTVLFSCGQFNCTLFCGSQVIFGCEMFVKVHLIKKIQLKILDFSEKCTEKHKVFKLQPAIIWVNMVEFQFLGPFLKTRNQGECS